MYILESIQWNWKPTLLASFSNSFSTPLNPFNGIERNTYTAAQHGNRTYKRIHSMELKGILSEASSPGLRVGIHSMELKAGRIIWSWARLLAPAENPFNGIEREDPDKFYVYYRIIAPQNPFNGIEREYRMSLTSPSPSSAWIHSMELKVLNEGDAEDASVSSEESIQWNWKAGLSPCAPALERSRIHSMELKACFHSCWRGEPEHVESIQWNWKTSTK